MELRHGKGKEKKIEHKEEFGGFIICFLTRSDEGTEGRLDFIGW